MNYFYKVTNKDAHNILDDLRDCFASHKNNMQYFDQTPVAVRIPLDNWNYVVENYPKIDEFRNKYNMNSTVTFFCTVGFFNPPRPPHIHNTKYNWGLLFPIQGTSKNVSTCFYEQVADNFKDQDYSMPGLNNCTTFFKSYEDLKLHSKFYSIDNDIYMFNGNQWHVPQIEGDNKNAADDRVVMYWYIQDTFENLKCLID